MREKLLAPNTMRVIFIIVLAVLIVGFFLQMNLTKGAEGKQVFFPNPTNTFLDYFNVQKNIYSMSPVTEGGQMYPPLAYFILYPFNSFLDYSSTHVADARTSQNGSMSLIMFFTIWLFIAAIFLIKLFQEKKWQGYIIVFLLFLSAPMLFLLERGNVNVSVLAFLAIFFSYYESDNKVSKEIAIIALAFATGIKIYPAIFGLLLLRKGGFLPFARLSLYCVVLLVAPMFLLRENFNSFVLIYNNINSWTEFITKSPPEFALISSIGFQSLFRAFSLKISGMESWYLMASKIVSYSMFFLSIMGSFFVKYKWQKVALLSCIIVMFPAISGFYSLAFMFISIIYFLQEKEKRFIDYVYMILFLIFLNPVQYGYWFEAVSASSVISNACAACINVMLCIEASIELIRLIKKVAVKKRLNSGSMEMEFN